MLWVDRIELAWVDRIDLELVCEIAFAQQLVPVWSLTFGEKSYFFVFFSRASPEDKLEFFNF